MGGGSKAGKGGGGGTGKAPQVNIPPEIGQIGNYTSNMGNNAYGLSQGAGAASGNTGNWWVDQMLKSQKGQQQQIPQEQAVLSRFEGQQEGMWNQGQGLYQESQGILNESQGIYNKFNTANGLTKEQNTMVDQQTASSQSALKTQLASMGLGSSTQGAELSGEMGLQGAATKGQLQQGNIQLQESALGIGNQSIGVGQTSLSQLEGLSTNRATLEMQGLGQIFNQNADIFKQDSGAQNSFFNQSLGAFGQSLQAYQDILQGHEYQAGLQEQQNQLNEQAQQASSQGASGLLSSLGSLLGMSGSGGAAGGIGAGISSLVGGGGAGAGAAAGAAAGASGGIGSALGAVGSVAGVLFCEVARTVYGEESSEWLLFRDWMIYEAPRWLRRWYVQNAERTAGFLRSHTLFKPIFKMVMDLAITTRE